MKEWLETATFLSNSHGNGSAVNSAKDHTVSATNDKEAKQTSHLLEFYEMYVGDGGAFMPQLDVQKTKEVAGELVEYEVSEELVRRYVEKACAPESQG